jgi:MFS family permease
MDSFEATQQAVVRSAPVNFSYANNTNNLKRSVVYSQSNIGLSWPNVETPYFIRKSRALALLNGLIRTKNATKQPSVSKLQYLLNYSTTNITIVRNTSSHLSYSKNPTRSSKIFHPQPWLSALFLILIFSRSQISVFERTDLALANLATVTYLQEENASYGAYFLWSQVGTALSISIVAVLSWLISIPICGVEKSGYFIAFICGFVIILLSLLSLPWFKFEYDEKKSFNWSDVKDNVFNAHHIFMFAVLFYAGLCFSFQASWEFWYLNGLSASPLLLGGAILIRRPLVALSTFGSSYLIRKIGDLNTACFALFLYSTSFLALSFTRIAWLVLLIDAFQAAAYGISYCAFTMLFYKASSPENSGIILGMYHVRVKAREPRLLARY